VKTTKGLPATASDEDVVVEGVVPAGAPVPAIGSPSFSGAPELEPGTYTDSILGAETLFYRAKVDWGQQLVCDATIEANPQADPYGTTSVSVQAYGFQRGLIDQPSDASDQAFYDSDKDVTVHAATPPLRYLNRESSSDSVASASMAGTYYCAVFINAGKNQVAGLGEIPLTIKVSTVGTAGEGKPDYLARPTSAKDSDNVGDDGGAFGVGAYAAIGAGMLALLTLAWTIRRRHRSS
jgi:Ca-activated chloride channel family protein